MVVGGIGRFASERWGMVRGDFSNRSDEDVSLTAIVTPPNSNGVQFARRVDVPARTSRIVEWPFYMPSSRPGLQEVEYLIFDAEDEDGAIQRRGPDLIRTLTTNLRLTEYGHAGWISSGRETPREAEHLRQLLVTMLADARREQIIVPVASGEITSAHALDALDQLSVSSDRLIDQPQVCEAIRQWVQRGGCLHVAVDQSGVEVARMLLGSALELTEIDRTSANTLQLDINPDYSPMRFRERQVVREFAEPADVVRVIADGGEVIWSIDDWPAAVRVDYGRGRVLLTMTVPGAFIEPAQGDQPARMIPSSSRFAETLFAPVQTELIPRELAVSTAAGQVGYEIPSRSFAAAIVVGFPLVLLAVGLWLQRRRRGEWLIWAVPAMAVLVCLPAAATGFLSRSVAPQTAVLRQVVRAVEGENALVADGYVTIYSPDAVELSVESTEQGLFIPPEEPDNRDYRRLVWTTAQDSQWTNLKPPVGIQCAQVRQMLSPGRSLRATATLDSEGLVGAVQPGDFSSPTDAILVGRIPQRQSVRFESGGAWRSAAGGVLSSGEYFTSSLLTQAQLQRAEVYREIFSERGRDAFPGRLNMLYWAESGASDIQIGDAQTRHDSSVLVVQPVTLMPPALGEPVVIPPILLPYRSVADATGGISTIFSNNQMAWTERQKGGEVTLAFEVPDECLPFSVSEASLELRIVAGSRDVEIASGPLSDLKPVERLESPVGSFPIRLPVSRLAPGDQIFVRFRVSDIKVAREEGVEAVEQDDAWLIERVLLTLSGSRNE